MMMMMMMMIIIIIIITIILHLSWGVLRSYQVQPSYYSH
jgi:hypothetical protein